MGLHNGSKRGQESAHLIKFLSKFDVVKRCASGRDLFPAFDGGSSCAKLFASLASLTIAICMLAGCGSTKSYTATDQLLMSDAVDATISKLDFSPLAGKRVYLDATYLKTQKSTLLIDSDYVISSLRQQLVGAGVQLVESRDECDLVAEARMGALGLDGHNVTYGIPANSGLASASAALTSVPVLPIIPEISFARHEAKTGAAKLAVFAYDRITREPYWQSGIAKSSSNARDTWVLGVGPWQRGTIYDRTRFAGGALNGTDLLDSDDKSIRESAAYDAYRRSRLYDPSRTNRPNPMATVSQVITAGGETKAGDETKDK